MKGEYIDERNGGYYVAGTRISLDSVVYSLRRGNSPGGIHEEYPLLSLQQILGATAFYLEHREAIDRYLEDKQREFEASAIPLSEADPELWARLVQARQATSVVDMGEPRSARFVSVHLMAA
ncbi:MAG: DUF433 domain-containing protein [Bryobacteraceae bacterium]|jgi:uncharacterized protein (DUF433 family)